MIARRGNAPSPAVVWIASVLAVALSPWSAWAVVANGPDDICAPTDDPCVVDDKYDVEAPGGVLDFGLRAVVILAGAEIRKSSTVSCGSFSATSTTNGLSVQTNEGSGVAGSFTVLARRACSGDGTTPCFRNGDCFGAGLGTCSAGPSGTITIDGKIESRGNDGGFVRLEAAADVNVNDVINVAAGAIGGEGGFIDLDSSMGSVTTTARLTGNAGAADHYSGSPSSAGGISVSAEQDVNIGGRVEFNGGESGCTVDIEATGQVNLSDDISCDAGKFAMSYGGYIRIYGDAGVSITGTATDETRLSTTGRSLFYYYDYAGNGGSQFFGSHTLIAVDEHSVIEAHTSFGGVPSCVDAYAGYISAFIYDGSLDFNGRVEADGRSRCGRGGRVKVDGGYYSPYVRFGPKSQIDIPGKVGGDLTIYSSGPHEFNGLINLSGRVRSGVNYNYYSGVGGTMTASYGVADITVGGTILSGSDGGLYSDLSLDACRVTLTDDADINLAHGEPWGSNFFPEGIDITAQEDLYIAPGAKIRTGKNEIGQQGKIRLIYSTHKPPAVLGDLDPDPELVPTVPADYCAVCGNAFLEFSESCDDGNTAGGDGCSDDCQDEGCIAATPGYPGVPLCDDGDACTVDTCDAIGHTCEHVASCEEGVPCTVDACVVGACEHTPDDNLCADDNECTIDTCNETTGCVHAELDGTACDDGDLCTVADACDTGNCAAADISLAGETRIKIKTKPGIDDDRGTIKSRLPTDSFTANPTVTGLLVETRDANDQVVHSGVLPAAGWEDKQGLGKKFSFRDRDGLYPQTNGIDKVSIKVSTTKGEAKISVKVKDVDLSGALAQLQMSASFLFGSDPSVDDCLTGVRIPCSVKPTVTNCR
jgi:cysteine-rich repeat protein